MHDDAVSEHAGLDPVAETLGPHPAVLVLTLIGLGIVAFFAFSQLVGIVGASSAGGGVQDLVEVPEVVGSNEATAVRSLEGAGLVPNVRRVQNVTHPVGVVISQEPLAGERTDIGATVELLVSAGDDFTVVPDIRGSSLDEIADLLARYGLQLGDIGFEDSDLAPNEVLGQFPSPGEVVALGAVVHVMGSSGPPLLALPEIEGMTSADAFRTLRDAGFEVEFVDRYSSTIERGLAISTDRNDEGEAYRGDRVLVYMSRGRPPATTQPPPPDTTVPEAIPTTTTTTVAPPPTVVPPMETVMPGTGP